MHIEPAEYAAIGTNQKTRRSKVRVDLVLVRNYHCQVGSHYPDFTLPQNWLHWPHTRQ